jgi:polyvinyl alcohol dehydrogenase (cytochrome)
MRSHGIPLALVIAFSTLPCTLCAQDGAALFQAHCASCHEADVESRAPARDVLRQMTPEQVVQALEKGAMSSQGSERSRSERRALAEYLTGKSLGDTPINPVPKSAFCAAGTGDFRKDATGPFWNGWGASATNSRFQPAAAAGLSAVDVPRLKLKWAFGFPGASSVGAQPVVYAGRVYTSTWEGDLYSLDAKTGCIHWTIATEGGLRGAVSVGPSMNGAANNGGAVAYVGDLAANVYAVDAETGKQIWKTKVDDYPLAVVTGSPTFYEGRLYVPVSSREESRVSDPKYPCCRFRGSVVALDAATGKQVWKTYMVDKPAAPTQKNRAGVELWGPSGVAVWVAPTVDAKRKVIYIGTGNNYSEPSTNMSDSLIALDMGSGKIRWVRQMTVNDIWNGNCRSATRDPAMCPDAEAPDFDFGASPILAQLDARRDLLIAGNKSGFIFALDPDQNGKTVWQTQVAKGGTQGGILWGPAVDGRNVYAAISDFTRLPGGLDPNAGGGVAAVALSEGERLWTAPASSCENKKPCSPAQAAAVSVIPGVVFSGAVNGVLRAYSTSDGKVLWEYDTARDFKTVNGVDGRGGSIDGAGPAITGGMLFTNSGYSHHSGIMPGNVLLAFSAE